MSAFLLGIDQGWGDLLVPAPVYFLSWRAMWTLLQGSFCVSKVLKKGNLLLVSKSPKSARFGCCQLGSCKISQDQPWRHPAQPGRLCGSPDLGQFGNHCFWSCTLSSQARMKHLFLLTLMGRHFSNPRQLYNIPICQCCQSKVRTKEYNGGGQGRTL